MSILKHSSLFVPTPPLTFSYIFFKKRSLHIIHQFNGSKPRNYDNPDIKSSIPTLPIYSDRLKRKKNIISTFVLSQKHTIPEKIYNSCLDREKAQLQLRTLYPPP